MKNNRFFIPLMETSTVIVFAHPVQDRNPTIWIYINRFNGHW